MWLNELAILYKLNHCRLHWLGSGGTGTEPSSDSNASEYFFESILAIT
jgi:hypothetical protein